MRGPYSSGPYMYVCEDCWRKPYLFWPDKIDFIRFSAVSTVNYGFHRFYETLIRQEEGSGSHPEVLSLTTFIEKPEFQSSVQFSIAGRKLTASINDVKLDQLHLDPDNVRFRHITRKMTEKDMDEYIWDEEDTKALYNDIKWARGLQNPLFIARAEQGYVVWEGNRRLVALRRLVGDINGGEIADLAVSNFDPVPCYVFPDGVKPYEKAVYLAREHVSGKREWRKLNQAAHVYELSEVYKYPDGEIATILNVSKPTVGHTIHAFKATMEYGKHYGDQDKQWLQRYSYFFEVLKRKDLKEWTQQDGNLALLMTKIAQPAFKRAEEVRQLPKVIKDDDALQAFEKGTMEDALEIINKKDPSIGSPSFKTLKDAIETLKNMPRSEILATVTDEARLRMLKELKVEVDSFLTEVSSAKGKPASKS